LAFRNLLDGAASIAAALFTSAVCGIPAWFTIVAVREGLAPVWVYAAAGGLVVIGLILTWAYLRKGLAGIAPTRQRRR
jgi:hypothetical protein